MFEPFERLGAEKSKVKGTGIGLTISKQLVEMMGGFMGVESKQGKFTSFLVDFRMNNPSPTARVY